MQVYGTDSSRFVTPMFRMRSYIGNDGNFPPITPPGYQALSHVEFEGYFLTPEEATKGFGARPMSFLEAVNKLTFG